MAYREVPKLEDADSKSNEDIIKKFLIDIGERKEFNSLKFTLPREVKDFSGFKVSPLIPLALPGLNLHGSQLFIQNYFSPDTPYSRLLVYWQTGTGKTLGVISISHEYIRMFRQQFALEPAKRPGVAIIGFTKSTIMLDMLKYPELGFISHAEIEEMRRLTALADIAGPASQEARHLAGLTGTIRRRITDRSRGGYYQFYGYKEFANHLFVITRQGIANKFDVQALYERSLRDDIEGEISTFGARLVAEVKKGNVTVNEELIESLKGGLVICDEIHNVYNMQEKNNYGIAIQYILDMLKDDAPRAVFMSATPMTGSAAEVIDLLNLLVPRKYLKNSLRRGDFFAPLGRESGATSVLLPGALEKIGQLSAGRVSFLLDTDAAAYPRRIFEGISVPEVPYLLFTECPMSTFHQHTFDAALKSDVADKSKLSMNARMVREEPSGEHDMEVNQLTDKSKISMNARMVREEPHSENDADKSKISMNARMVREEPDGENDADKSKISMNARMVREEPDGENDADKSKISMNARMVREEPDGENDADKSKISMNARMVREEPHGENDKRLSQLTDKSKISMNAQSLFDIAFPNPATSKYGLYESGETMAAIIGASAEWKEATGVTILRGAEAGVSQGTTVISGNFLNIKNLRKYSEKYARMMEHVLKYVQKTPGKIMIYHHRVRMSGVLLIQEILRMNGFIDELTNPTDSTICAICGIERSKHTDANHTYTPARFVVAHSDIDKTTMLRSIAKFNAGSNKEGYQFRVLIGSKIIKESFNFKSIREMLIMSMPTDIPTLIQIFGRGVRKESHAELPMDERTVVIRIFVSVRNLDYPLVPEIARYSDKMREYLVIQEVEREFRRFAVDGFANFGRMANLVSRATIDSLPFEPAILNLPPAANDGGVSTFAAYHHAEKEVRIIGRIIQTIFGVRPVWKFDDLFAAIRGGGIRVGYDPEQFSKENFALALQDVQRPFGNPPSVIIHRPPFYILVRVGPGGYRELDMESYIRNTPTRPTNVSVKISDYMQSQYKDRRFEVKLQNFTQKYLLNGIPDLSLVEVEGSFHSTLSKNLVEELFRLGAGKTAVTGSRDGDQKLIDLYLRFKLLISAGEVYGAPAATLYKRTDSPRLSPDVIVGYMHRRGVSLFTGSEWQEVPHSTLNIGRRQNENKTIVGFVTEELTAKFKIRPPITKIAESHSHRHVDIRSLIRGAVCETRPRADLAAIVEKLKVLTRAIQSWRLSSSQNIRRFPSTSELCHNIKIMLLELEEHSRAQPHGMLDGVRWLYLPQDKAPSVSVAAR